MSRLDQLHKLLEKTPGDPFLAYGIAMEHKKAGERERAIEWFDKTITLDSKYCYAYYQKGQTLEAMGQMGGAVETYRAGIVAARSAGDAHAEGEIQAALDMLG